jgi:hypothetical protein
MSTQIITNIDNAEILIHSNKSTLPLLDIGENEYFGILNTKITKTKLVKTPTLIKFTIDKTGSMDDEDKSGNTKLHYVIETFINMMNYLSTLDSDIFVQVNTFDVTVDELVECVKITTDNVEEINSKIRGITCYGSTDIGLALSTANKELIKYAEENPYHQRAHIFMTDGDATTGILSTPVLVDLVDESFSNIFIGFGFYHNVELLSKMADNKNSEYQFIDNMENTSLVYGEIIHKFIYPALRNVQFNIENGVLYDWQKNEWTSCLYEDIIIGETEKIYHIKTSQPHNTIVHISGELASIPDSFDNVDFSGEFKLLETAMSMPDLQDIETGEILSSDLTKYAFRQKVQELLFRSKNYVINLHTSLKNELREVFRTIHKYMRLNNMLDDGLLKMLCDDIVITYRTIGKQNGKVMALSRQTTQGRQRSYNVSSGQPNNDEEEYHHLQRQNAIFPNNMFTPPIALPKLRRTNTVCNNATIPEPDDSQNYLHATDELNNNTFKLYDESGFFNPPTTVFRKLFHDNDEFLAEDEIESYIPVSNDTTFYATPDVLHTMRAVSCGK